jgi:hypothetical protein
MHIAPPLPGHTVSYFRDRFCYDPETGILRWIWHRRSAHIGREAGTKLQKSGYLLVELDGRKYYVHRVIWLIVYGHWPEYEIDHIDGDPTNNKLENLRDIPHSKNCLNRKKCRKYNEFLDNYIYFR